MHVCVCLDLLVNLADNLSYLCNRDILKTIHLALYFWEIRFQISSAIIKGLQIVTHVK
jgi:hypothetical protein